MFTGPDFQPPAHAAITPALVGRGVKTVLLFGGTFDPPHAAHAGLPLEVRDRMLGADSWLLYVPAARNPLKPVGPEASEEHRLEMLRLLLAERADARSSIWTDELDRARVAKEPNYTTDTVHRLRTVLGPGVNIRLLVGSDQAADFHRWRDARTLFARTKPLVMLRAPYTTALTLEHALASTGAWTAGEVRAWVTRLADTDLIDLSSSKIRGLLRAKPRSEEALAALLTPSVLGYIEKHQLYQVG